MCLEVFKAFPAFHKSNDIFAAFDLGRKAGIAIGGKFVAYAAGFGAYQRDIFFNDGNEFIAAVVVQFRCGNNKNHDVFPLYITTVTGVTITQGRVFANRRKVFPERKIPPAGR